jgi:pSer/pThr/pTyr-binding forkhead associated (FHA) protein
MSMILADIEQRIENLIEIHLVKFLPGQSWHDKIAKQLTKSLKVNIPSDDMDRLISPNVILYIHPTVLAEWQKEPRLLDGLTKIFRLATSEAGLKFQSAPTISLATLETLSPDDIEVHIGGKSIAETQGAQNQEALLENDALSKVAFLIIGGTKVYSIDQMVVNIGRRLDNQVVIDDPRVSRYHAQIRYVRDKFIVFDLNSTGGTYVNGQRISQSVLYPGDVISLAGMPIIFGQDAPPSGLKKTSGDTAPLSQQSSERKTAALKDPGIRKNDPK